MLNTLRLTSGFELRLFTDNTGLLLNLILPLLNKAKAQGLLEYNTQRIYPTERGLQYLNDLQTLFLDPKINKNQLLFWLEYRDYTQAKIDFHLLSIDFYQKNKIILISS